MASPSPAVQQIDNARQRAASELKKTLADVYASTRGFADAVYSRSGKRAAMAYAEEADDITPYLPAIREFVIAHHDTAAAALMAVCIDPVRFRSALESEFNPQITESFTPRGSLTFSPGRSEERQIAISVDQGSRIIRRLASDAGYSKKTNPSPQTVAAYAMHGDWENLAPEGMRYLLRDEKIARIVNEAIAQALSQRTLYWVHRFEQAAAMRRLLQSAAETPAAPKAKAVPRTNGHSRNIENTDLALRLSTHLAESGERQNAFAARSRVAERTLRSVKTTSRATKDIWDLIEKALAAAQ